MTWGFFVYVSAKTFGKIHYMKYKKLHPWKPTVKKAKEIQLKLASQVKTSPAFNDISEIKTLAACDVSYRIKTNSVIASIVVMDFRTLTITEKIQIKDRYDKMFPYIPGLLSFREIPPLLKAFKKVKNSVDVVLVDGQGIAHPRYFGLGSHLGLILDKPTIGCAKSRLYGSFEEPPPGLKGAYTFLKDGGGYLIGLVMRSRPYTTPLFISPGHKMGIEMAGDVIIECVRRYRIPEPLRIAHQMTQKMIKP